MRYLGSKKSTLSQLELYVTEPRGSATFGDLFGGIGVVSALFKSKGYRVITADQLVFATYFQTATLEYSIHPSFRKLRTKYGWSRGMDVITELNQCRNLGSNWLVTEYSIRRRFFKPENAKLIQSAWNQIRAWDGDGLLNRKERAFLLASLINSMDYVANTAGTYYAYLKGWTRKAINPFTFKFLKPVRGAKDCTVIHGDASTIHENHEFEFLYLDPPYNGRNYSLYYHLPETIARCEEPTVRGKAGVPNREPLYSLMYRSTTAKELLSDILRQSEFDTVAIQYCNDGLVPLKFIRSELHAICRSVRAYRLNSWRYTNTSRPRNSEQILFLANR